MSRLHPALLFFISIVIFVPEFTWAQKQAFVQNKGQWDQKIQFRADIPDGKVFFEKTGFTYLIYNGSQVEQNHHLGTPEKLDCHSLKISFPGSLTSPVLSGDEVKSTYYNFYLGNDSSKWASGVRGFGKLYYRNLFEGIDLELSLIESGLKYTFHVASIADPADIRIKYKGANKINLRKGEIHIQTSLGEIVELTPYAFQWVGDQKVVVPCQFSLNENVIGFDFPEGYDDNYPLIIDPVVIFASYSGSTADNFGYSATYDDSGYAYSSGTVFDIGFPTTTGAFQLTFKGGIIDNNYGSGPGRDVGILKYTPDGINLIYATYLGGACNEDPHSMVVNSDYELLVFGNTCSSDFPIGNSFYDSSYNGNYDIFLAKFSPDGKTLQASTFVGGSAQDALNGYFIKTSTINQSKLGYNYGDIYRGEVNVNSYDEVFVVTTTKSNNFPVTSGVFQPAYGGGLQDACVFKMSKNLNNLTSSSFIGGNNDDAGYGIALDTGGNIFVTGGTISSDLPMIPGKYQTTFQGGDADGYIYKISGDFKNLLASTYFGTTNYDQTYFVQTDINGNVYTTGQTKNGTFPIKNVKLSQPGSKQFITKFNNGLDSIIYSTTFGSGRPEIDLSPSAFLVDYCERVYFSGWGGITNHWGVNRGYTSNLMVTPDAYQPSTDGSDFYVAVFAKDMEKLLYATYFGGTLSHDHVDGGTSRFDKNARIYQSVCASCGGYRSDFPTYPSNVHSDSNLSNNCNNAIFKIDLDIPDLAADFSVDTIFCLADSTRIKNLSLGAKSFLWQFSDGDTSTAIEPLHRFSDTGIYSVTLIAFNIFSCDQSDTITKTVYVFNHANSNFSFDTSKCTNFLVFEGESKFGEKFYWDFGDGKSSALKSPFHLYADSGNYQVTFTVDSGTVCEHRTVKFIHVGDLPRSAFSETIDTCLGRAVFVNLSKNTDSWLWNFGDGDTSVSQNPVHFYKKADSFSIMLIAHPYSYCADTSLGKIFIKTPKADAVIELDTCNLKAQFYNPSTYVKNASIWDFGDGTDTSSVDSVWHQYQAFGTYTVMLIANSGTICVDTIYHQFYLPPLPDASFSWSRAECDPNVVFKNLSSNFNSIVWDFGDGSQSSLKDSVIHLYQSGGNFQVTLKAISLFGCKDTFSIPVKINRLAHADFELDWDTCTNKVSFKNKSTQNVQYFWNYGDGMTSTETAANHTHFYDTLGIWKDTSKTYSVTIVVVDSTCKDSLKSSVTIHVPPAITFSVIYDSCLPVVKFQSSAAGAKNYLWNFGDDHYSYAKDTTYQYSKTGDYTVKFSINVNQICFSTVDQNIHVTDYMDEEIIIPNVFTPNGDNINDIFRIKGLNFNCDHYKFIVYNRWGQEVFVSDGKNFEWDGTYEGIKVTAGAYFYVFESSKLNQAGTISIFYDK